ncbi:unnamed protein product, partial [Soboliphyme baturini]|uniref:Structural maintenance of chromosomes protein 5 n=1 Tax=Soboliphyme baturini TaxID=241478 RepID=A0A183IZE8_9BILA
MVGDEEDWKRTYSELDMKPHENLNFIFGPNGTVDPRARANIHVVRFEMNAKSSNSFFIDDVHKTRDEVKRFISRYRIQVENICQFMAQDQVTEFARQSPQALLQNTEKAVGSSDLFARHMQLIQWQKEINDMKEVIVSKKETLKKLKNRITHLAPVVKARMEWEKSVQAIRQYMTDELRFQCGKQFDELHIKDQEINHSRCTTEVLRKTIQGLTEDINKIDEAQEAELTQKIAEINLECEKITDCLCEERAAKREVERRQMQDKNMAERLERDLKHFLDVKEGKLRFLEVHFNSEYRAYMWYQEHKEKFSGMVYFPFLTIDVPCAEYLKFVEAALTLRDIFS